MQMYNAYQVGVVFSTKCEVVIVDNSTYMYACMYYWLYQVEVLNNLAVEDVLSFMTYLLLNLVSRINILSPMFTATLYI